MKKFLEKGYQVIFLVLLAGLFAKGEVFRVTTSWFSLSFTSVKNITLLFICWGFLLWLVRRKGNLRGFSPWVILVILTGLITSMFSQYQPESWVAVIVLVIYLGWFYALWQILADKRNVLVSVFMLIIIGAVVNVVDLYFHCSVSPGQIIERYPFWAGKNALGLFLVLNLCFSGSILGANVVKKRVYVWLLALNIILLLTGLAFTYSRGAWLAGLVALVGLLGMRWRKLIWLVLVTGLILLCLAPPLISNRLQSIFDINEVNIQSRFKVWKNTVTLIEEHPLLGSGPGSFTEAYRQQQEEILPARGEVTRIIRHAHSLYLQLLVETGLLGILVFFLLVLVGSYRGIKNLLSTPPGLFRAIRYGCLLGIFCFLFYSLTDCPFSWQFVGDSFSQLMLIWLLMWVIVLKDYAENKV